MDRLKHAAQLAELNIEALDQPFLVGALAKIAAWHQAEKHLKALGKDSICTNIREEGEKILSLPKPYFIEDNDPEQMDIPTLITLPKR